MFVFGQLQKPSLLLNNVFYCPKMGKTVFDLCSFYFIFAFKQGKEQILFKVKPFKMLNKTYILLLLG